MPTGTMPSAIRVSWSVRPTQTTRSGAFSIVVSPYLCLMVTGKAPSSVPGAPAPSAPEPGPLPPESLSLPQAARTGATARTDRPARKRRREVELIMLLGVSRGVGTGRLTGSRLLQHRREPLERVLEAERREEVERTGEGAVGVDGAPLGHGRQRADRAEVLQLVEHVGVLGREDDHVGLEQVGVLRGDLRLRADVGRVAVETLGHREAQVGEEAGAQTVGVDVEDAVVRAALREGRR